MPDAPWKEGDLEMPKPDNFTDKMFWKMVDCNMSNPVPLAEADLTKPFVYERRWGVFYVPFGYHAISMSLLLAWQNNCDSPIDVGDLLGLRASDETADHWLEHTEGAAFRSSVGKQIQVATRKGLTVQERRLFGDVACVFEDN